MIISVSRRTDIPSRYSEWFFNRIAEEYVLVRNPVNRHKISRITLNPDVVDGMVFWSKNPVPMLPRLSELEKYAYYFQFTLTPYGTDIEPNLPSKREVIIPAFIELSDKIGADRVIWRYDPILINEKYTPERHIACFEMMAGILKGYTKKCVISFIDSYKNTARHAESLRLKNITHQDMRLIGQAFSRTAEKCGMELSTCSESIELGEYGISHAHCVDGGLFETLAGCRLEVKKDRNQRKECGCAESIDIGDYNSCRNLCRYCYANYNEALVEKNYGMHDPHAPLLFGKVGKDDEVTERNIKSLRDYQIRFLF